MEHQGEAKWEARGVSEVEWRKLPDTAKVFLLVLLKTIGLE